MSSARVLVRSATSLDASGIDRMLRELAHLEGTTHAIEYRLEDLVFALSSPNLPMRAVVAVDAGELVGCVTFTKDFALWSGGPILRIDDVFVDGRYRRTGVGRAMMGEVAVIALEENAPVRWEIEPGNTAALEFYANLGAVLKPKVVARWSIDAMKRVVSSDIPALQDAG
jgi:GNAT superfamily N-acetyltransferase